MRIRVTCPECSAPLQMDPVHAGRIGRCPRCSAPVPVPPPAPRSPPAAGSPQIEEAEESHAVDRLRRAREKPPRSRIALILGIALCVWGLLAPVWSILGFGLIAAAWDAYPVVGLSQVLALEGLLGLLMVTGGVGILIREPFGWWLSASAAALGVVDVVRVVISLVSLVDWDHPEAGSVLPVLFLAQGVPAALHFAMLGLLLLPRIRRDYRVSVEPRARPRPRTELGRRSGPR